VHIGDSTSEGLVSSDYLPDPAQRLRAQYARVGVTEEHFEITGATSIVETLSGGTNAYEVARRLASNGYRGCWVIALGTNDTADVYVGSSVGLSTRIKRMMSVIGDEPVMWVNVKSLVAGGPYAEANMQLWNQALVQACSEYPNMRVFDWASLARAAWFIPDGIHYTSAGYAARAHLIANALAQAFPASGETRPPSCIVRPRPISERVLGVKR
jgi:lysophospholipase L1-like esterase